MTQEPDAATPQQKQFRLQVDEAHCDRAAQGLRLMAQYQYRSLVQRYEANARIKQAQRVVRKIVPLIAALAFVAGLASIWMGCTNLPHRLVYFGLAAVLFLETLALCLLPRRAERIGARIRASSEKYFGNRRRSRRSTTCAATC